MRDGRGYRWRGALTSMFAERDKLRAVARKGWVGSGDAFDSLVTTSPCFEFTQRPRVGNESPGFALLELRPPSAPSVRAL